MCLVFARHNVMEWSRVLMEQGWEFWWFIVGI